jgi:hypothetical protein
LAGRGSGRATRGARGEPLFAQRAAEALTLVAFAIIDTSLPLYIHISIATLQIFLMKVESIY